MTKGRRFKALASSRRRASVYSSTSFSLRTYSPELRRKISLRMVSAVRSISIGMVRVSKKTLGSQCPNHATSLPSPQELQGLSWFSHVPFLTFNSISRATPTTLNLNDPWRGSSNGHSLQ